MIDETKLEELRQLIGQKSNEMDEYISFDMNISCHGLTEIDEYPEDYPEDGDAILENGQVRIKFSVYRSTGGHENFEDIEDAIQTIRRYRTRKRDQLPKTNMMAAQDACAEYREKPIYSDDGI